MRFTLSQFCITIFFQGVLGKSISNSHNEIRGSAFPVNILSFDLLSEMSYFEANDEIRALAMKELQDLENKKLIQNLYRDVFMNANLSAAYNYFDPLYIQHAPYVADGLEALIAAFKKMPTELTIEMNQIGADGDLVFIHSKTVGLPDGSNHAVVAIYRVKNQKVVEHWDVTQQYKLFANSHPFF